MKSTLKIFSFLVFVFAFASIAEAQATRTWVSGVGDDVNPCSRTAPCKTFAGAISKTATNGEINCLDPGGYGAVTITKSITIDCEDTQGSILASLVNGVIVNSSTAHVKLRGLSIQGVGNGINCVRVITAASLVLDEVACAGFAQHGVSVENSSGAPKIAIWNSSFRNNAGNGINSFVTGTGSVTIAVRSSLFALNSRAVNLGGINAKASVEDSIITGNTTDGLRADGATSSLTAANNQISHNATGVFAATGAVVRIGANTVTFNTTGLSGAGATLCSFGSNFVDGNNANGAVTGACAPNQ
jgi:hypothetical protein